MEEIASRTPVDKKTARVCGKGIHWDCDKKIEASDSYTPIKTRKVPPNCEDLTGFKFGRFTVVGLSCKRTQHGKGKNLWVVKCSCGIYTERRAKSIKNPNNNLDRCEICRHKLHVKRHYLFLNTGKDVDWKDIP